MIEKNQDRTEVFIGDGDVLIDERAFTDPNFVRLSFGLLPVGHTRQLNEMQNLTGQGVPIPADEAVVLYFLNRGGLDTFIELLVKSRDAAFPVVEEKT